MSTAQTSAAPAAGINAFRPRILHTAYFVTDIDRALAFYCGLLGMQEQQRFELDGGVKEVILTFPESKGGGVILMWNPTSPVTYQKTAGYHRFVMMVSDLDAVFRHLTENKVKVTKGVTDAGALRYCMIEDPDGYAIEVLQLKR
jgi:catechol 2,3-dioxygenase-like lactoylglutathione lyase family enzyme